MADIICTSEEALISVVDQRREQGMSDLPDYCIEVADGDGHPLLRVTTAPCRDLEPHEAHLFLKHIAAAERAMNVGASCLIAVYFDDHQEAA